MTAKRKSKVKLTLFAPPFGRDSMKTSDSGGLAFLYSALLHVRLLAFVMALLIGAPSALYAEDNKMGATIILPPDAPKRMLGETDAERAKKLVEWLKQNPEIANCAPDRLVKDVSGKLSCKEPARLSATESPFTYRDFYMPDGVREMDAQGKQGNGGTYRQDVNIWVYTRQFAKRFGMPEQWIDDNLKGAQAIAYRNIWLPGADCNVRIDKCNSSTMSFVDVYVDSDVPLPWLVPANNKEFRNTCWGAVSSCFLKPPQGPDSEYMRRRYAPALEGVGYWRISGGRNSWAVENKKILDFQRDLYPGIDFISLTLAGFEASFHQDGLTLMFFRRMDRHPKANDPQDFMEWRRQAVVHEIEVPAAFMQRVRRYYEAWMQMNRESKDAFPRFFPWPPAMAARDEKLKK